MANERVHTDESVSLKLIGPNGEVKSNTTGIGSDIEARKRQLAAFVFKLLNNKR